MIDIKEKFKASAAIIDYKSGRNHYLEVHPIHKGKLGAGKPLTMESLSSLSRHLMKVEKQHRKVWQFDGMMPSNILHISTGDRQTETLIWYCKPQKRQMNFVDSLNIPNGEASQPAVVFVVRATPFGGFRGMDIYSIKTSNPQHDTELFKAPYHNVKDNVCMGSVKVPHFRSIDDLMNKVETVFYTSKFSHSWQDESINKGNINLFWAEMINNKVSKFPTDLLIPSNKKIKNLIYGTSY